MRRTTTRLPPHLAPLDLYLSQSLLPNLSFFVKFLTGAAVAGGLTTYYHDDIARTTDKLSSDLRTLSQKLVQATPSSTPSNEVVLASGKVVIPQRLPFTEELKARWNEQLGSALYAVQSTSYTDLAAQTYAKLASSLASAQAAAPSAPSAPVVSVHSAPPANVGTPEPVLVEKVQERRI